MGIVLALTVIFGLVITSQVRSNVTTMLTRELEKQGIAITKNLAARSTDLTLTGNSYDLYQLIKSTVQGNEEIKYAMILDPNGGIVSHSFSGGVPIGLAEINMVEPNTSSQIVRLDTNEDLILDIAVPIFGGRAGISRVGMSTHLLQEAIADATRQWIFITGASALIGLVATYLLTSVLTKPILQLVGVTKAVIEGDLYRKANVWAPDEIGRLASSFNEMTLYLSKAKIDNETYQAELIRRNLELAILVSVGNEINRSQGLADMIRRSFMKVTEFLGIEAGWVGILSDDKKQTNIIFHTGLSDETFREIKKIDYLSCTCKDAIQKKSPVLINYKDKKANCPVLAHTLEDGKPIFYHVSVPLVSKSNILGLMHLVSTEFNPIKKDQLSLLDAIGNQMGIAIENAKLWEEIKHREELRGYLLEEAISAQESERKRIARELHDQTGQLLTSLMVGLKTLKVNTSKNSQNKIQDMRNLAATALDEVHNIALELRPSSLDDLGLVAALEQYTREYTEKFKIPIDFQTIGFNNKRLLPEVEITLYRIIQEALTNIVKHTEAERVSVLLEIRDTTAVAIIEDNGQGFDVKKSSQTATQKNLGLHGMYERAALINGTLSIESELDSGTTIHVEVPIKME